MRIKFTVTMFLLTLICGCEPPTAKAPKAAVPQPPTVAQFAPRVSAGETKSTAGNIATTITPNNVTTSAAAAPGMVREQATSALTAKGKYTVDIALTPVSAYFTVKDQVVFQFQIPKALEYYELANGRKPRTYEEFQREVIEKNRIQLPELPPTHRYFYDPDTAALMVEHPAAGSPN